MVAFLLRELRFHLFVLGLQQGIRYRVGAQVFLDVAVGQRHGLSIFHFCQEFRGLVQALFHGFLAQHFGSHHLLGHHLGHLRAGGLALCFHHLNNGINTLLADGDAIYARGGHGDACGRAHGEGNQGLLESLVHC